MVSGTPHRSGDHTACLETDTPATRARSLRSHGSLVFLRLELNFNNESANNAKNAKKNEEITPAAWLTPRVTA